VGRASRLSLQKKAVLFIGNGQDARSTRAAGPRKNAKYETVFCHRARSKGIEFRPLRSHSARAAFNVILISSGWSLAIPAALAAKGAWAYVFSQDF
jgi:hypothetical protein